jgi:hypothetical protein
MCGDSCYSLRQGELANNLVYHVYRARPRSKHPIKREGTRPRHLGASYNPANDQATPLRSPTIWYLIFENNGSCLLTNSALSRQGGRGSSSSPSSFDIEVPFSNKNDTVPPGTSFTVRSGLVPMREMLSRSTASSSDDKRPFGELPVCSTSPSCEGDDWNNNLRRMSSCTRSAASRRRQLI